MKQKQPKKTSGRKKPPPPRAKLSPAKKLLFSAITVPLMLVMLEVALALFGVHPAIYESDPYVGFAPVPLYVEQSSPDGTIQLVTAKNKLKFFNPQSFPRKKPAGAYRIFSIGGSTTNGRPYDDATSFSGWLREYLKATSPEREWEVINAGGISYASYRAALVMEELIEYEPDLFIIYSGHNEFLEERTYGDIKDTPASVLRLSSWAARSRAATLVSNAMRRVGSMWSETPNKSHLSDEVDTKMIGLEAYKRDDALQEKVLKHYRYNLLRMIDIAHSIGARVVLIVPASNLLGRSPFKNEHRAGLTESELADWNEHYQLATEKWRQRAAEKWRRGAAAEALAALDEAVKIDDRHAETHYFRGLVLEQLGRYDEAKIALVRAMDEDVCPLRALSPTSEIVAQVAKEREIPLIDFVAIQEEHSPHGIPGREVFFDHVHPTIESHRLLALEILSVMENEGIVSPDLDDAKLLQVKHDVESRIDAAAEARALMNLSKVLGWANKLGEAYYWAGEAIGKDPKSPAVRYQAGLTAQMVGKLDEAIVHYGRAIKLAPRHALAHGNLADALEMGGHLDAAIRHYKLALQYGESEDAQRNQGNLTRAQQKLQQRKRSN